MSMHSQTRHGGTMNSELSRDTRYLHVCSLGSVADVARRLVRFDLVTLLSPDHASGDQRVVGRERHLKLSFHDITEIRPGFVAPDSAMMQDVIAFARDARDRPMLIHCWAGISRSSAAAYAIACDRNPGFERMIADELRRRAPSVTPNRLMVEIADELLGRNGRMIEAIARIGRGADAFFGDPYRLPSSWPIECSQRSPAETRSRTSAR